MNWSTHPVAFVFPSDLSGHKSIKSGGHQGDLQIKVCFVNPGAMQWTSDLIGYDTMTAYGSPAYWAQHMFANHHGDSVVNIIASGLPYREYAPSGRRCGPPGAPGQAAPATNALVPPTPMPRAMPDMFFSATKDSNTVYVKIVNRSTVPQQVQFTVTGLTSISPNGKTTTVHDNCLMFIKINFQMPVSPTNRDEVAKTELELRRRQFQAVQLFRKFVPGCEKGFIARTSPSLNIRRARLITCDYDITHEDVIEGRHFDDQVFVYGFHDMAPRLQVKNGGTCGIPYRALRVAGIENLLAAGMMITSDHRAHMSTRNTVSCMGQGQAAGTAAALCSRKKCPTRELRYADLRATLEKAGVYFES
jgi:hypothetical protein